MARKWQSRLKQFFSFKVGLPQNFRDILKELPKTQALDADKYGYHVDENIGLG